MEDIAEIAALACGSSLGAICSGSAPSQLSPNLLAYSMIVVNRLLTSVQPGPSLGHVVFAFSIIPRQAAPTRDSPLAATILFSARGTSIAPGTQTTCEIVNLFFSLVASQLKHNFDFLFVVAAANYCDVFSQFLASSILSTVVTIV